MVVILMGVSGSGKTTVGRLLAGELGWSFYDGDDFHPRANVLKMAGGTPLDDRDRAPWLDALAGLVEACVERGERAVVACSALREAYRRRLLVDDRVKLIYLKGEYELIRDRLARRAGHFMRPELLASQFEALEEPGAEAHVDASAPPSEVVRAIRERLGI